MSATVTAAPSWHESTLQWMREKCPQHLAYVRGTNEEKLYKALIRSGYALRENGHDEKRQAKIIKSLLPGWCLDDHNDFRSFVEGGGYVAPRTRIAAPAAKRTRKMAGVEPMVIDGPNGPEVIEIEEEAPGESSPAAQRVMSELQDDPRYGAW